MEPERLARAPPRTLTSHRSPLTPRPSPSPAPPWITENKAMLAELALLSSAQPHPAYASTSSAVQPMLTLAHFEAALERARQHNRLVVIKFYQATTAPDHRPRPQPQTTAPDQSPTAATGPSHPHTAPRRAATLTLPPDPEPEPEPMAEPGAL